ncbi:MAG: DUF4062 domain-containing protein, partial [Anaerolineae bacterium]|nr:DUF4062 domain-containing protein [Anaerolineae bacterium]
MTQTLSVFISSKMQELAAERAAIRDLLPTLGSATLDLAAWVYENDAPASENTIRQIYLDALNNAALYLGIFWHEYGAWTIDEFDRATEWGIERHVYVKNVEAEKRDPKLTAFLDKHSGVTSGVAMKWFKDIDELKAAVTDSITYFIAQRVMTRRGAISAVFYQDAAQVFDAPERLIGRDDLLATIAPQIARAGHILLHGFGGIGKTALAGTLAKQHIAAGRGPVLWLRAGS